MTKRIPLLLAAAVACGIIGLVLAPVASAATFNANRIMDDGVFDNPLTMNSATIDNFLNQFPSSCISPNHGFRAPVPTGYSPSSGFSYGGNDTAGAVIATAAQVYNVNPQVLITTLQKEQSLVTGGRSDGCPTIAYTAAMGYGCPDSGGGYNYTGVNLYSINGVTVSTVNGTCVNSSAKAGFSQQVIRAAWLLKFSEQRSKGNVGWAIVRGNWNNSDDPQSCYSGPMTEGTYQRCPSGATVYYSGVTNIDGTAVHMDSGTTAALYYYTPHFHGNQVFNDRFTDWFGNPYTPYAFTTPGDPTIYIYISGYKLVVYSMAVLQDYGISPQSIQTISQAAADAIPAPTVDSGVSNGISYLMKSTSDTDSDGGALYIVSVGKRWQIQNMSQFDDFGFDASTIVKLPIGYITSFPSGGMLSSFVQSPTNNAFQVSGGEKQIIFDYATYHALNPGGNSTLLSYFLTDLIPSGNPLSNRDVLVKRAGSDQISLFTNNTYYGIPNFATYSCWGFESTQGAPLYTVQPSYVSTIAPTSNLNCLTSNGGTTFLLNNVNKVTVPAGYSITGATAADSNTTTLMGRIPTHATPLKQFVKANDGDAIWYIQNGVRKLIPTYNNFLLLGASIAQVDILGGTALNSIPVSGVKLATGTLVKTSASPSVYVINGSSRVLYSSSVNFVGYHNDWNDIETYPAATLDADYPAAGTNIQQYYYDGANTVYVINEHVCYAIPTSSLSAYGLDQTTIANNQTYVAGVFPHFNTGSCHAATTYVKSPGSSQVYWIDSGQKHLFTSWSQLTAKAHTENPDIMTIDSVALGSVSTGSPVQ